MLKSILVATFMITAFTFVTVGTVSMTSEQAFAKTKDKKEKKKEKVKEVGEKKGDRLFMLCTMYGGSIRVSSTGANIRCCKGNRCITCPTTVKGGCKKKWKTLQSIKKPGLSTGSIGTQLAPTKNKRKRRLPIKVKRR